MAEHQGGREDEGGNRLTSARPTKITDEHIDILGLIHPFGDGFNPEDATRDAASCRPALHRSLVAGATIGDRLFMSPESLKADMKQIVQKLGVENCTQALVDGTRHRVDLPGASMLL